MRLRFLATVVFCLFPVLLTAQEISAEEEAYIRANTIFFTYHELGHALIDLLRLPVFGQEEDAADVLGVVLSEAINAPDDNDFIMLAAADNFAYMAAIAEEEGYELAFWDTHGLDQQRYYTILCLYYGADPASRQAMASAQELPEERQQSCPDEWELAEESWGAVLDDIVRDGGDQPWITLNVASKPETELEAIVLDALQIEVDGLNEIFMPEVDLLVTFDKCGEANAFYDPGNEEVIICAELVELFME